MPDKFKIATAVLSLAIIYDARVNRRNQAKFERIAQDNHNLREALDEAHRRSFYLASIVDKNEIALDEFDEIAIINPM